MYACMQTLQLKAGHHLGCIYSMLILQTFVLYALSKREINKDSL